MAGCFLSKCHLLLVFAHICVCTIVDTEYVYDVTLYKTGCCGTFQCHNACECCDYYMCFNHPFLGIHSILQETLLNPRLYSLGVTNQTVLVGN